MYCSCKKKEKDRLPAKKKRISAMQAGLGEQPGAYDRPFPIGFFKRKHLLVGKTWLRTGFEIIHRVYRQVVGLDFGLTASREICSTS